MFKVGDIVEAFGVEGIVTEIRSHLRRSVFVNFEGEDGTWDSFLSDGRYADWQVEASLILLKRPRKKVVKTLYPAIHTTQLADSGYAVSDNLYSDIEAARKELEPRVVVGLGPAIQIEIDEDEV